MCLQYFQKGWYLTVKLKNGFQLHRIGNETYAVAAVPELAKLGSMIRLNGTAEFLFRLLGEETSEEELTAALLREYEITEEAAAADVAAFCARLREGGFLA